jgi:transcriptional regulator with XRE-family HTH domain
MGKANKSVRFVRETLGKSQEQFAALVGVSKDAVVNWENGRTGLSAANAQRIRMATGADTPSLLKGNGLVMDDTGLPYAKAYFDKWTKHLFSTDEATAKRLCQQAAESVELLYMAAGMKDSRNKDRLPAFHAAMLEWLNQAYKDFALGPQVKSILEKRKHSTSHTMTYGQWREDRAEGYRKFYGFKDNASKPDDAELTLKVECWPIWNAGSKMTPPKQPSTR